MQLPDFKYRPNPLETGSIEKSDSIYNCCGTVTEDIYAGPVFAEEELDNYICPWCNANEKAHNKYDAEFSMINGIENYRIIGDRPQFIYHPSTRNFSMFGNRGLFPNIATFFPGTSRHQGDIV